MDEVRARVRKSMRDSFPEIFGEDWGKGRSIFIKRQYRAIHLEQLKPLPLAVEVLQAVKARKLFCTVVSNKKGHNLRQEIEHLGWNPYFDTIVGSDDAAAR